MFTKVLASLLALHMIMLISGTGRSCNFWKELHGNSYALYHSMQLTGERLEGHIRTIDLLLQKFSKTADLWMDEHLRDTQKWMEEYMGWLTGLVSVNAQSLCDCLEQHVQDLSAWFSVNFGNLQECPDTNTKAFGFELGIESVAHDEHSGKPVNQSDTWLDQHARIVLNEQWGTDLLNIYEVLEKYASNVSSSLEDCVVTHIQLLQDHIEILEQLWDSCAATINMWLEEYNAAKEALF